MDRAAPLRLSGFRNLFSDFFGGFGLPDWMGNLVFRLSLCLGIGRFLIGCLINGRFCGGVCYVILAVRRCRIARVVGGCFGIVDLSVARKHFMALQRKDELALSGQAKGRTAAPV